MTDDSGLLSSLIEASRYWPPANIAALSQISPAARSPAIRFVGFHARNIDSPVLCTVVVTGRFTGSGDG